jgi:hypothetical protein
MQHARSSNSLHMGVWGASFHEYGASGQSSNTPRSQHKDVLGRRDRVLGQPIAATVVPA